MDCTPVYLQRLCWIFSTTCRCVMVLVFKIIKYSLQIWPLFNRKERPTAVSLALIILFLQERTVVWECYAGQKRLANEKQNKAFCFHIKIELYKSLVLLRIQRDDSNPFEDKGYRKTLGVSFKEHKNERRCMTTAQYTHRTSGTFIVIMARPCLPPRYAAKNHSTWNFMQKVVAAEEDRVSHGGTTTRNGQAGDCRSCCALQIIQVNGQPSQRRHLSECPQKRLGMTGVSQLHNYFSQEGRTRRANINSTHRLAHMSLNKMLLNLQPLRRN